MGNLLRVLSRDSSLMSAEAGSTSCCSGIPASSSGDLFVDFESAQPSQEDFELFSEAEEVIVAAKTVLADLKEYKGASKEIREAIANVNPDSQAIAWSALQPLLKKQRTFFHFSKKMKDIMPKILAVMSATSPDVIVAHHSKLVIMELLDDHQALVKQLAKLLDFALKFDECKMMTPALQNDLSFYRRSLQRHRKTPSLMHESSDDIIIPLDEANSMSLFFAHATPMMKELSEVTSSFVSSSDDSVAKNTTDMLGLMAKVCQKMLDSPELRARLKYEETELFILRVMVATIILYDHVHKSGAFVKGSCIDIKSCVRVLKDRDGSQSENLLNALRYTTKHLNDDNTPRNIKSLLFDDMV